MDLFADHFKLEVEIVTDRCTRQVSYVSDPARGVRRQRVVEEWTRDKRIGAGTSGEVFLERNDVGKVRAVKRMAKPQGGDLSNYMRELVAMARLSKVQYSTWL